MNDKTVNSTYVRTLCRPTMKATFLLHGLIKDDQLVSTVRYSPLLARIRRGECSNGCPANWRTDAEEKVDQLCVSQSFRFFFTAYLNQEHPSHFSYVRPPWGVCPLDAHKPTPVYQPGPEAGNPTEERPCKGERGRIIQLFKKMMRQKMRKWDSFREDY